MREFQMKRLFWYEIKKIAGRKIVWFSMVVAMVLTLFTVIVPLVGDYYVDGTVISSNYEQFQIDKTYKKALNGRAIDDDLIREMQAAYDKVDVEAYRYSLTEAYQKYARPYSEIFHYVRQNTGLGNRATLENVSGARNMWERRKVLQEERWNDLLLTELEKAFWRENETKIENPITYRYADGYSVLFDTCYTVGIVGLFVIAICMANVFPNEHIRKTDQLILCSEYGRKHIFWMKFFAGVVMALVMISLLVVTAFFVSFLVYGVEGFDGAFQMYYVGSSLPFSIGGAVIIAYAMVICAACFMAVVVMLLSEVLHSSVGTLAITTALIVAPMMVSVPDEYRVLAQLWSMMPGDFVAVWSIFSARTVVLFDKVFTMWQVVPFVYLMLSIVFAFWAKRCFIKYEISGR